MIAVEIPAALAADPQVVPVDHWIGRDGLPIEGPQRVALAWRETCPTCKGLGCTCPGFCERADDHVCPDCTNGERMVVGWTAEVEVVAPIVKVDTGKTVELYGKTHVLVHWNGDAELWFPPGGGDPIALPPADWSPGRYALVLRSHNNAPLGGLPGDAVQVRPFTGFAELSEVADSDTGGT